MGLGSSWSPATPSSDHWQSEVHPTSFKGRPWGPGWPASAPSRDSPVSGGQEASHFVWAGGVLKYSYSQPTAPSPILLACRFLRCVSYISPLCHLSNTNLSTRTEKSTGQNCPLYALTQRLSAGLILSRMGFWQCLGALLVVTAGENGALAPSGYRPGSCSVFCNIHNPQQQRVSSPESVGLRWEISPQKTFVCSLFLNRIEL